MNEPNADRPVVGAGSDQATSTLGAAAAAAAGQPTVVAQPAIQLAPGARFGAYRIVRQIGIGGMGVVYEAVDTALDRVVALKLLKPELTKDSAFGERFLREARAAARVQHQHVVTIYAAGEIAGVLYMALELVAGGDLAERIRRHGPLSPADALRVMLECAEGLQAIHEKGIVHRDINPQNIFIDDKGRAKLGDLGLARSTAGHDRLTATGAMMGTPAYMAPEQAEGIADVDVRADIHALGASLYTMLTGRVPYEGPSLWAVFRKVMEQPPPDPRTVNTGVSARVSTVVLKAMAKDRSERYQTPGELLCAVRQLHAAHQATAGGGTRITRIAERGTSEEEACAQTADGGGPAHGAPVPGRALLAVALAALLMGAGLGGYAVWSRGRPDPAAAERPRVVADAVLPPLAEPDAHAVGLRAGDRSLHIKDLIASIDLLVADDPEQPALVARVREREAALLAEASEAEQRSIARAWERWQERLKPVASQERARNAPVGNKRAIHDAAERVDTAVERISDAADKALIAARKAGDVADRAVARADQANQQVEQPRQPVPAPAIVPAGAVAAGEQPSAETTREVAAPSAALLLPTLARPAPPPLRRPDPSAVKAIILDLRAHADDAALARVHALVDDFAASSDEPQAVAGLRAELDLRTSEVMRYRREQHIRHEQERLRPLLARLDTVSPLPAEASRWMREFATVVPDDDHDLARWRDKMHSVAALKQVAVAMDRPDAVLEREALVAVRDALARLVELVGEDDPETRTWRTLAPGWASRLGRDAHGAWADLVLAEVVQRFRWCPPGRFLQGVRPGEIKRSDAEVPLAVQREVRLTRGFWLADSECTQALWVSVMGSTGSHHAGPDRPVDTVRWPECHDFLTRLSARVPGFAARLPSEAEWEYACRAGSEGAYAGMPLEDFAWFGGDSSTRTHAVRAKTPNRWGFYDMHGNVWEWCQDALLPFPPGPAVDPLAVPPYPGAKVVVRGGSCAASAVACHSGNRYGEAPGGRNRYLGLRIACSSP